MSRSLFTALGTPATSPEEAEFAALVAEFYFRFLVKFARVDGPLSEAEVQYFLSKLAQLPNYQDSWLAHLAEADPEPLPLFELAEQLTSVLSAIDPDLLLMAYQSLWEIAALQTELTRPKALVLRLFPSLMSLPPGSFEAHYQEYWGEKAQDTAPPPPEESPSLDRCYALLGCDPSATTADLTHAFKQRIRQFHPDKIQGKNLAPEFLAFATRQTQEINQAYRLILSARGLGRA